MPAPILATKLYVPPPRAQVVLRPRLEERLNEGLDRKLTLISASAGFGKTTLVSQWVNQKAEGGRIKSLDGTAIRDVTIRDSILHPFPVAWLSLDEGDSDLVRFLTYLVAALQRLALSGVEGIAANIGEGMLGALQSPQPPSAESILTALLNEITSIPSDFVLVLDDYHLIDAKPIDDALSFLLEHLPPQMHLVIATREDPYLPLSRLRARGQLTEVRAADLRFTAAEAAEFLNQVMGLKLSAGDVAALEARTEGWIAGLQLAALSMQGRNDVTGFIEAFTGSHHFVLDYLVQEVLNRQPTSVQTFLLRTSILDRLCGPLCDAVLLDPSVSGQATLEYLEHANLFVVPLDDERSWYRYHHLFAGFLRQRLHQSVSSGNEEVGVAEYHIRASQWYEDNGLELEAFNHAAAAKDIERAARLIEEDGIPLHFRGAVTAILNWLESLPPTVLNARPYLWWKYASLLLVTGQTTGVEEKLEAAEAAVQGIPSAVKGSDDKARNLVGQIAAARATLALTHYDPVTMLTESRRALEYLHPDNLSARFGANWTMAMAYQFRGERAAAGRAHSEGLSIAQASGNILNASLATICLGQIQELENQLYPAAETYRRSLQLIGDYYSPPSAGEAYLGLARICYEWNDLDAAEQYGQQSLQLARQYGQVIDRFIISEVFLARLKLARGDVAGAAAKLAETERSVRENNFVHRMPEVAAAQVVILLKQANLPAAAVLARRFELPLSQARVLLAQGDYSAALAVLAAFRQEMEARGWADERLKAMVLQAIALHLKGERESAAKLLGDSLALAEPGGFIRLFIDEGEPMRSLISDCRSKIENRMLAEYAERLLGAFPAVPSEARNRGPQIENRGSKILVEPLSERELEVLRLIAQGLSNREIGERLFLALSTVKGHSRIIFDKLQVRNRTEAVARARELGLL